MKQLVKSAFTPDELEYLLNDASFRLVYDSDDERSATYEALCKRGHEMLTSGGFYSKPRRIAS